MGVVQCPVYVQCAAVAGSQVANTKCTPIAPVTLDNIPLAKLMFAYTTIARGEKGEGGWGEKQPGCRLLDLIALQK